MGLDVYLYSVAEREQNDRHSAEWDALYERKERGEITDAQFHDLQESITPYASSTDKPSERYPAHLFNRRYLRSSYNTSGFNRAVSDFLGGYGDLYWIFEPMGREWDGDEGLLTIADVPLLEEGKARADRIAKELRTCDPLRAEALHPPLLGNQEHLWSALPTEEQVLDWYRDEQQRVSSFPSYSCAKGDVYKEGRTVVAVTLGRDVLNQPAPVVVYRSDALDSYIQSAEITAEFCDEAIDLIKQDGSAYIFWSG